MVIIRGALYNTSRLASPSVAPPPTCCSLCLNSTPGAPHPQFQAELESMMAEVDMNSSNVIEFNEFLTLMVKKMEVS